MNSNVDENVTSVQNCINSASQFVLAEVQRQ